MSYDGAGRLSVMQTGAFSGNSIVLSDLVRDISYTPFGALQSEKYGNGLIHSMGYNNRQQPTEIRLGRPDNLESVFRIGYIYGTANNVNVQDPEITLAHNNGNLARIKYFINGTLQYSQTFLYDGFNRLSYAVEHKNGAYNDASRAWYQTFVYDPYGNRGVDVDNTSDNVDAANTALRLADFSAANNRIMRAEYAYDADGNLTDVPGKEYFYDAENRLYKAIVGGVVTSQYFYGANDRRVRTVVGGVATRFEYGKDGELITEWNDVDSGRVALKDYFYKDGELLATTKEGGGYEYATADHLGSPRAWTSGQNGNLTSLRRCDYMAFGEDLFAGYGTRTTDQGYAVNTQTDGQRKRFGSHELDNETGLYFMQARYFSSLQGRFTSVDPSSKGTTPTEPQTWNKYIYAKNNPLQYVDKNGKWPTSTHNEILRRALGGLYPTTLRQIQIGAESVDAGKSGLNPFKYTLQEKNAPQHAMTPGTWVRIFGLETAKQMAMQEAQNFINANIKNAKDLLAKSQAFRKAGNELGAAQLMAESFQAFGAATHTIMDSFSPAHMGYQVYDGFRLMVYNNSGDLIKTAIEYGLGMLDHKGIEKREPDRWEYHFMALEIQRLFLEVYGRDLYEKAVRRNSNNCSTHNRQGTCP
jgi:RHS repeat-associated protein